MKKKEWIARKERYQIQLLITFEGTKVKGNYFIENLNDGGLFLEISPLIAIGTEVSLSFILPHNREEHRVRGVVKWTKSKSQDKCARTGVGIAFVDLDKDKGSKLIQALEHYKRLLS